MPMLETAAGRMSYFDNDCIEADASNLLLLHSGAATHRQWRQLMAQMGNGWRILAPDLVGYGDTPLIPSATIQDEVALLAALLQQVNGPVHVIGHSYGGALALELARHQPSRIATLALYEPVMFGLLRDSEQQDAWREIALVAHRHIDLVAAGDLTGAASAFLGYWTAPGSFEALPAAMQASVTAVMGKVAIDFRHMLQAGVAPPDFSMLTMPVLLLNGSDTTCAARGVVAELRHLLPASRCIEIPGARHMAPLLQPDLVNPLLLDFVKIAAQVAQPARRRTG